MRLLPRRAAYNVWKWSMCVAGPRAEKAKPPNPLRPKVSNAEPKTSEHNVCSIGLESSIFPFLPFSLIFSL